MNALDIILLPFVFIYRGFISVLLLPYYFVMGIVKVLGINNNNNNKTTIAEIKPGEEVKVIKGTRSAYSTPKTPPKETDPVKIAEIKKLNTLKKQKDFEKLVAKARAEEEKRAKEQEKIRAENEKKEKERQARLLEKQKREEMLEAAREKKEEELKSKGEPVTFLDKLNSFYKKLTYNKREELELEAKKIALIEQFKDKENQTSRFTKPLAFEYKARNVNGVLEKGTIEALSRIDVLSFLEAEGYDVYEIVAAKVVKQRTRRMKKSKLIFYLSQLSAYLKSGIALADAVKILDNQAKNINEKMAWRAVYYDLSMGDVLSVAMEKRNNTFPRLLINMIKTAEMTGNLPETLDDMVDYYSESESTRKQMKSAMMYPLIVTIFASVVITFILMWVVPQFESMYADMGSELPGITKFVIWISDFLIKNLLYILIVIIFLLFVFIYLFKNIKSFRKSVQQISMHLPVFGNIIKYNEVTIFAKTFANLINHNVFITDSIDVLSKITTNEIYIKLIYDTAKNLTKGDPISKAFEDHWAFPNIAYQMLITGEKTGRLGPMMERVSNYYQEQHRTIINQMKSLIEPIMIVTLAVLVGGILLAVIIPMYGMFSNF